MEGVPDLAVDLPARPGASRSPATLSSSAWRSNPMAHVGIVVDDLAAARVFFV
jgi:hypothetical protein